MFIMISVRRAVEKSIISLETDDPSRVTEIETVRNPAKRAGLVAVHKLATHHPRLASKFLHIGPRIPDLSYLTEGYVSDVYKVGEDTVLKIDRDSVSMTRREKLRLAARMRQEHAALIDYVGPAILPHTVEIGPHPEERTATAVRIVQPFVEVDFLKLNEEEEGIPLLVERLRQSESGCPELMDDLDVMVTGSLALYEEQTLATDILGADNVGISSDTNHVIIIDAQPVTTQYPKAQVDISRYFDNLGVAIALAA